MAKKGGANMLAREVVKGLTARCFYETAIHVVNYQKQCGISPFFQENHLVRKVLNNANLCN